MKRFLKYTLITLLALPLLAAAFLWGLYLTADMEPPEGGQLGTAKSGIS